MKGKWIKQQDPNETHPIPRRGKLVFVTCALYDFSGFLKDYFVDKSFTDNCFYIHNWYGEGCRDDDIKIIFAWMPFPEPYRKIPEEMLKFDLDEAWFYEDKLFEKEKEKCVFVENTSATQLRSSEDDEWIPCSEHLPEEGKYVQVTELHNDSCDVHNFSPSDLLVNISCYKNIFNDKNLNWSIVHGDHISGIGRVIAWRPLPERYKDVFSYYDY